MAKFTSATILYIAIEIFAFFTPFCTATTNTAVTLSSTSQCVALFDTSTQRNDTRTIPQDQLPTTATTTTSGVGLVKTIVLGPKPYTITENSTLIFHEVTSVTGANRGTTYTSTVTVESTSWITETVTTKIDQTVSLATTTTVPAFPGYTPLEAKSEYAGQKFVAESANAWETQDEYWDVDQGSYPRVAICNRGSHATAVMCYVTVYTAEFSSTLTLRRSASQQTYTRTRYTDTDTWTRTVAVYVTTGSTTIIATNLYSTVIYSSVRSVVTATETVSCHHLIG